MITNTIPDGTGTVQVARQKAPKDAKVNRVPVRSHGQFRARDTYWNRPMSKEEKQFLTQRDKWGSRRHDKTLTPEEREFAWVQFNLWHAAFCKAGEAADAAHAQKQRGENHA